MNHGPGVCPRGRSLLAIGVLALSAALASASGADEVDTGEVVVLITDHREAIDDFTALVVTVDGVRVHRRGARTDQGWLAITVDPREIDLTRYKDGATVELVREHVPVGRYDAAEVLASGARGTVHGGDHVDVPLELTPVRADLHVLADRVTQVTFDLVVHDLRDHPGKTWGVLLEEVRVEHASGSMVHDDAAHDHGAHDHETAFEVPAGTTAPTVGISVDRDAMTGWNVALSIENFTFAPERASGAHVMGEGHAHLYVDGVKIARLYGPWYHIAELSPGMRTVEVKLSTNDHSIYAVNGEEVSASVTIAVPE